MKIVIRKSHCHDRNFFDGKAIWIIASIDSVHCVFVNRDVQSRKTAESCGSAEFKLLFSARGSGNLERGKATIERFSRFVRHEGGAK